MILMAGIARPVNVVIYEQLRTLGKAQGATETEIDMLTVPWHFAFEKAKDLSVPGSEPITVGSTTLPVMYLRDWLRRDPVATMKTLQVAVLVLHGSHDVNSTEKDFQLLSQAGPASEITAKDYPGLNHLFMPTESMGNGVDELMPGHVSPEVIGDIAAWIRPE